MNRALKIKLVILFLLCGISTSKINAQNNTDKPNVLFIAVDDLNNWLGCLNNYSNTKTPNIDRLAASGVLFSNAQCQAPLCGPSRASIMSGLRPSTTGIYGMISDEKIRNPENPSNERNNISYQSILEIMAITPWELENCFMTTRLMVYLMNLEVREKGFGPYPEKRFVWDGFGTSDRKQYGRTSTDWGAFPERDDQMPDHQSVNWTIERLNKDYDKPFFMGLGFLRPHVPLYVPQKWFDYASA